MTGSMPALDFIEWRTAIMTTTETAAGNAEDQIRETIDAFMGAMKRRDIDAIMSFYAPDVVAFDVMPPLSYVGRDAYRKSWDTGLSMMFGPLETELRNLKISVSGDVANCHALNRMAMNMENGERMDSWMRWTWCLKRSQGRWFIAHEHVSFPIDMETDKALTTLEPEQ